MLALLAAGCPPHPVTPAQPRGGLLIEVEPSHARIYVDEQLVGDATTYAQRPLKLAPGHHRIKVLADGYYPEYLEVQVTEELVPVGLVLTAVPEPLGVELQ